MEGSPPEGRQFLTPAARQVGESGVFTRPACCLGNKGSARMDPSLPWPLPRGGGDRDAGEDARSACA